jgi:hypothetical protein
MPPAAEIAVEAAAVARNRRRDTGMRTIIASSSRKETKMAADSHSIMTVDPCESGDGG